MATKEEPGEFDCYENAEPDEPMFVLLARDITAPSTIYEWAGKRIRDGKNQPGDPQIMEALKCADNMRKWRKENREV